MTAGFTTDLLYGFAQLLADNGAGVWRPSGPKYTDTEIGIVLRTIAQSPDRLITLSPYVVSDPAGVSDITQGVQVRTRGPVGDVTVPDDIADACYLILHGLEKVTVNGISVVQCYRESSAPIGQDPANRWERSDNYYVDAMRPTVHNRE